MHQYSNLTCCHSVFHPPYSVLRTDADTDTTAATSPAAPCSIILLRPRQVRVHVCAVSSVALLRLNAIYRAPSGRRRGAKHPLTCTWMPSRLLVIHASRVLQASQHWPLQETCPSSAGIKALPKSKTLALPASICARARGLDGGLPSTCSQFSSRGAISERPDLR
jgi:hypothetical protein